MKIQRILFTLGLCGIISMCSVVAQDNESDLAKKTQNPISDLISLPFQLNINSGIDNFKPGDGITHADDTQWILNIQPVIPVSLNEDWNLINRTILPVISQPDLGPGRGDEFGLGDMTHSMFFSPKESGKLVFEEVVWGFGPIFQFPTSTDPSLGAGEWGLGPTVVALTMPGNWVIGALASNVWSLGNDEVNFGVFQYFINYNFDDGWYATSAPINTVNWNAASGEKWTVPLGLGFGKVHKFGKQPVNMSAHAYYNVEHPALGADWQFRLQVQLLFPK